MPARARMALMTEGGEPLFMEKIACPAARASFMRSSPPPRSRSRTVSTASASCAMSACHVSMTHQRCHISSGIVKGFALSQDGSL